MEYKIFSVLADMILDGEAIRATKYFSDKMVVSATRQRFGGKVLHGKNAVIIFKVGKPNFKEREFIKLCKKAGEPFPIKKIQIKVE